MFRTAITLIFVGISLILPPLLGAWYAGHDPMQYLQFPFMTPPAQHAPFSWTALISMSVFVFVVVGIFLRIALCTDTKTELPKQQPIGHFPWWGYAGLILVGIAWLFAWNRFDWFETFQLYTFTPIWLGYIFSINAFTNYRSGHCLLLHQPKLMCGLFLLSAVVWWYYEYLNGFIHNWYYVNTESLTTIEYTIHSTIAYATVLPAVISTLELLNTIPRMGRSFSNLWRTPPLPTKIVANTCWLGGLITLGCAALWPEQLFLLVWIAPLFIITGGRYLSGESICFTSIARGDWRPFVLPAIAALICGFFWELWNSQSYAHWEYNIPYVDVFHLFEMPAIGYAGYLPFGLVCLAIAELLPGSKDFLGQQFHPSHK